MADSWTHLRHTKKRSVKFSEGMHKPQWVVAADNGKAVVSPKIVEFGRHCFPEENAQSKKCTNFLAWLLAHLDAECHALRPPALPDGYLRDTLKNTARQLRRNQRQPFIARKDDGTCQDLHKHISANMGVLWIVQLMQEGIRNWSEKDIMQTPVDAQTLG
jgi:hypothetical protein